MILKGTGNGDIAYNARRKILGALPVRGKTLYHLFTVDTSTLSDGGAVKLCQKSKWHSQNIKEHVDNMIAGLDFELNGEKAAAIDASGTCLVLDINTNDIKQEFNLGGQIGKWFPISQTFTIFYNWHLYLL